MCLSSSSSTAEFPGPAASHVCHACGVRPAAGCAHMQRRHLITAVPGHCAGLLLVGMHATWPWLRITRMIDAVRRYVSLSLLTAGFFVRLSQLKIAPMRWLSFISYPRHGPAQLTALCCALCSVQAAVWPGQTLCLRRFSTEGVSFLELNGVDFYEPGV